MKKWQKTFKSFQILVPGSISNLGCGFDTLGMAVSLYFKTSIHSSPHFSFEMNCNHKRLDLPDEENLFLTVLRKCYPVSPEDWNFTIQIETEIPPRKGLGSSACATISALLSVARLMNLRQEPSRILNSALQWEHHPDNLCASILGGFTAAMQDGSGVVYYHKLLFPKNMRVLLLIPEWEVSTETARRLLPEVYPKSAVIGNLQRLAYFLGCLQEGNFHGIRESVRDQVHQPYRATLMPFASDLLEAKNFPEDTAIMISGSGPTFAVLYRVHQNRIRSVIQQIMSLHAVHYELRNVLIDPEGARIENLED